MENFVMRSLAMALKKTACLLSLVLFVHSPQAYGSGTGKIDPRAGVPAQQLQSDLGGLKIVEKKEAVSNKKLHYKIKIALPQLAGVDSARVEKFNQAVAKLAAAQTREFKKRVNEYLHDPLSDEVDKWKSASPPPPYRLIISYKVISADKDLISVLFPCYVDYHGPHGSPFTMSFNYDLNRNAPVSLVDLFTQNSGYLKVISNYSIKKLKKQGKGYFAEFGAVPEVENFHTWNIIPAGLKITFDACQVDEYAAGERVVIVPYSVLKRIIRPDGLLAQFAK